MSLSSDLEAYFSGNHKEIISEPLKFKAKLGIGERAYTLLNARDQLRTFTEALGIGSAAATFASSSWIAGTFFAQTGIVTTVLSAVGLGAAAVTPIGWVVGAGLISGTAYLGVSRVFERSKNGGLVIIPKYINTPIDIIAMALIELMLPLSLKVASVDGKIHPSERRAIREYFFGEWGYCSGFIKKIMTLYEERIDSIDYSTLSVSLHEYCIKNKDCNPDVITEDLIEHLNEVVAADGQTSEEESRHLEALTKALTLTESPSIYRKIRDSITRRLPWLQKQIMRKSDSEPNTSTNESAALPTFSNRNAHENVAAHFKALSKLLDEEGQTEKWMVQRDLVLLSFRNSLAEMEYSENSALRGADPFFGDDEYQDLKQTIEIRKKISRKLKELREIEKVSAKKQAVGTGLPSAKRSTPKKAVLTKKPAVKKVAVEKSL